MMTEIQVQCFSTQNISGISQQHNYPKQLKKMGTCFKKTKNQNKTKQNKTKQNKTKHMKWIHTARLA